MYWSSVTPSLSVRTYTARSMRGSSSIVDLRSFRSRLDGRPTDGGAARGSGVQDAAVRRGPRLQPGRRDCGAAHRAEAVRGGRDAGERGVDLGQPQAERGPQRVRLRALEPDRRALRV